MRMRHGVWLLLGVLLLTWSPITLANAASVTGRSSTELEWYDTAAGETAVPFYQYLLLNARDIDDNGLVFRGYGRVADAFANDDTIDSRLYYAYLEKEELWDDLDVRFGRQFISTTAGTSIMDGLYLDYHDLGPLDVSLFGGGDVTYYEGYNAEDLIGGMDVSGSFFDGLYLGFSYLQKWDERDLANELFGLDLNYDWNQALDLYSETQFDYLANSVSYFLAGVRYHKNADWSLRSEYLYSLPVFSSTSIYSVFAVDEYREVFVGADLRLAEGVHGFTNYTREMYEEGADADVVEIGIEKIRTGRYSGYLSGIVRADPDGQDLVGFKIYGSAAICPEFQIGAGLNLDVLERDIDDEEDDTTSSRAWVDGTVTISSKMNVQAKAERVESVLWDEYYRGRVRLNVRF